MTLDRFTYRGRYDAITYSLAMVRYGDRAHARLALRSDRGVLLATHRAGLLEVLLPPVRATDVLLQTSEALAAIGQPAEHWRQLLAVHDNRIGLLADRWYHVSDFTASAVEQLCAHLPLAQARITTRETRPFAGVKQERVIPTSPTGNR